MTGFKERKRQGNESKDWFVTRTVVWIFSVGKLRTGRPHGKDEAAKPTLVISLTSIFAVLGR